MRWILAASGAGPPGGIYGGHQAGGLAPQAPKKQKIPLSGERKRVPLRLPIEKEGIINIIINPK